MKGFSLLELLIVIGLCAALGAMSVSGYNDYRQKIAADQGVNQLKAAVVFARLAAIDKQAVVILCPSPDGKHCGGAWQAGYLCATLAANGQIDHRLKVYPRTPLGRLFWRGRPSRAALFFNSTGGENRQNGRFVYCPNDGRLAHRRVLMINRLGRARRANRHETKHLSGLC
jgi:type IV fimbrial biogenesis protein FimT